MTYTYTLMTKFINIKYYTYEKTLNMLDVYMGFGRISVEQYAELSILANEVYGISLDDAFNQDATGSDATAEETPTEDEVTTLPADDTTSTEETPVAA